MNIEEIEQKLGQLDDLVIKMKELVADAKVCSSEITKSMIFTAIKKFAANVSDFKLEQ